MEGGCGEKAYVVGKFVKAHQVIDEPRYWRSAGRFVLEWNDHGESAPRADEPLLSGQPFCRSFHCYSRERQIPDGLLTGKRVAPRLLRTIGVLRKALWTPTPCGLTCIKHYKVVRFACETAGVGEENIRPPSREGSQVSYYQ